MRHIRSLGLTIAGTSPCFLAVSLTLASMNVVAADVDCKTLKKNNEIYSCLNDYAKRQLAKDSPADKLFSDRLERMFKKYELLSARVKTQSLADSFTIYVDQTPQLKDGDSSATCFDFEGQSSLMGHRGKMIEHVRLQIDEVAKFLAEIHASSFGHQVSLLFPIKEVSICSEEQLKDRKVSFEQRSLHVGLSTTPLKSHQLIQVWNSGHPIRSTELHWYNAIPFLGDTLRLISNAKNPEAILRDKMADKWMILNPTGTLRTTALYTLAEAIFKIKAGQDIANPSGTETSSNVFSTMRNVVRGPGFSPADSERLELLSREPGAIDGLYRLWQQKIYSPQNILTVIENAIGDQARRSQHLHLALRRINAPISVLNDKSVSVRLEQLMQNSIPVASFNDTASDAGAVLEYNRTKTTTGQDGAVTTDTTSVRVTGAHDLNVNADDVKSLISINLIDDIVVSVQIPNISPATYRRVCLHQALNEFLTESEGKLN